MDMSAIPTSPENNGELYARALDATRPYIAAVRDDQWSLPTPCTEWNLRQLVNHVLYGTLWIKDIFDGRTVGEVGSKYDGDLIGEDALASYDAAVASAKAAVLEPGAMEKTCHLRRGDTSGADYCRSMFIDILIHGWDIGKALGQDPELSPDLIAACYEFVKARKSRPSTGTAFASPIDVPETAPLQTQVLAILGRTA